MSYKRLLLVVIGLMFLHSCSTTSNQNKVINMDTNDPLGMYIKMMNFVLPIEVNGV